MLRLVLPKTPRARRLGPPFLVVLVLLCAPEAGTTSGLPAQPAAGNTVVVSFSQLVEASTPAVVNIYTVRVIKSDGSRPLPFGPGDPFRDFFERYFRDQMPKDFEQQSLGTGFVVDTEGLILTNNHVVEQTDAIKVRLFDDSEYPAQIVGKDPKTDLALIRIQPQLPLTTLPLGDSDLVKVGDWVVAIGNPFGLGNTVTAGIVSAKYRELGGGAYGNLIQTDTSINPGNSGGPLLNTEGQVIGINTGLFSEGGGSVGIGFAIPINTAKELLPQLKEGRVVRGWLGVMIQKITPELKEKLGLRAERGVLISDVAAGGPADETGIRRGDVIVTFDGKPIRSPKDLPPLVAAASVGKSVPVEVMRKEGRVVFQVTIQELQEEEQETTPSRQVTADPATTRLGMRLQEITPEISRQYDLPVISGMIVTEVENNTPAADAGIVPGDIIVEMDQRPVNDLFTLRKRLQIYRDGGILLLLVHREVYTLYVTLTLPPLPPAAVR